MDNLLSVPIQVQQDRKFYTEEIENPAITTEFEGGYVASRPRHNRNPLRRTWTFGYTDMSNADKLLLQGFYNAQKGGSKVWYWCNWAEFQNAIYAYMQAHPGTPLSVAYGFVDRGQFTYKVRFTDALHFDPKGYGMQLRFDCPSIKIQEA